MVTNTPHKTLIIEETVVYIYLRRGTGIWKFSVLYTLFCVYRATLKNCHNNNNNQLGNFGISVTYQADYFNIMESVLEQVPGLGIVP